MRADFLHRATLSLIPVLLAAAALFGLAPTAARAEPASAPNPALTQSAPGSEAAPAAADPELEARVMDLSHVLRCLVCQNQSVAESHAPLAVDLRNQVREQLAAGKSEAEVIDFMTARYGDFVLYMPPFKATTLLLWVGPALLLVGCAGWLAWRLRRRTREAPPALTPEDHLRARALLEGAPLSPKEPRS